MQHSTNEAIETHGWAIAQEVLGKPLKQEGPNAIYRVPWREDRDPSLYVLMRPHNGHQPGFWKDFGRDESGDVIDLVMKVKGIGFADAVAYCESQLGLRKNGYGRNGATNRPNGRRLAAKTIPTPKSLAAAYGLAWDDFEEAGCSWTTGQVLGPALPPPFIGYPIRLPDGSEASKFKTVTRIDGKRESRPAQPGSGWQMGLFDCGLDHSKDATLVITEGEEKALVARAAGRCAVAPPNGAGSFGKGQAEMVVAAAPSRIVLAFDADVAGDRGTAGAAKALKMAGFTGELLAVHWPEDSVEGRDLNDVAVEEGLPALDDFLDAAAPFSALAPSPNAELPEPLPLDGRSLPLFPIIAFSSAPALRNYVIALAEETQTPADLAGMLALGGLSAATRGRITIKAKEGWSETSNLYIIASQPPGSRKSAVVAAVAKPLNDAERDMASSTALERSRVKSHRAALEARLSELGKRAAKCDSEDSRNDVIGKMTDVQQQLDALPPASPPRLLCEDVTPEKLGSLLCETGGSMAIISDEGTIASVALGRYSDGSPNFEILLKAHDGSPIRIDRRNRTETIERPTLTLALCVQDAVMQEMARKKVTRGKGLLARFLFICPKTLLGSRKADPEPMPRFVAEAFAQLIRRVLTASEPDTRTELQLSKEAQALLIRFSSALEPRLGPDGDLRDIADWAGKLAGAGVVRIAGLLHLAEGGAAPGVISRETLDRAILIAEYLIPHAQAAFNVMFAPPELEDARHVLKWIKRKGLREFRACDAWQTNKSTSRFQVMKSLRDALACLEDHGHIIHRPSLKRSSRGGRPASKHYIVNPKLFPGNTPPIPPEQA